MAAGLICVAAAKGLDVLVEVLIERRMRDLDQHDKRDQK